MNDEKKIIAICIICALVSCEKQDMIQCGELDYAEDSLALFGGLSSRNDSKTIPSEIALENLHKIKSELYSETKSNSDDILNIEVFGNLETKSTSISLPDTLLYIVNFTDNGFAILAGQTNLTSSVFCITEEGTLSTYNMEYALKKPSLDVDSKSMSELEDEDFEDCGEIVIPMIILSSAINQMDMTQKEYINEDIETKSDVYRDVNKFGPYLKTKWHQDSPFNDFQKNGYPAGCVAIATAQILEFNKKGNPDKMNFDWALLETVNNCSDVNSYGSPLAKKEASRFLQYVGNGDNCDIKYKKGGSSGNANGAKRTFRNFGYRNVDKSLGFEKKDKKKVIAQLKKGLPVYMDGMYKLKSGHAWVIDGLYVRDVLDANTRNYIRTENLFHINWGWQGMSDGYYSQGVFDTSKRVATESGVDAGYMSSRNQYTWDYRTIVYDLN